MNSADSSVPAHRSPPSSFSQDFSGRSISQTCPGRALASAGRDGAGFHAAFELDASADEIALFDADLLISKYAVPANWQATTASPGADGG